MADGTYVSCLVHSYECAKAAALNIFRIILGGGPRRRSLKMWFPALKF